MKDLCKYKDLFGKPNTGLRKYRIFDIAILDTAVVIIIGYLISWYFKWNLWITLASLFLFGIFAHKIFCVRTGVDKLLFSNK
jgi:ABC-type transport system involved in multi-copper enzyme maturation permease subunit